VGQRLARAFAARDVDAIAALITPGCWIGTIPAVPPGVGVDGSSRAVVPLLAELRDAFARDGLAVVVAPDPDFDASGTSAFLRSDWTASGATVRIDLELRTIDGTFFWSGARHYDLASGSCPIIRVIAGSSTGRC
jgi:hypothetical protein